MSYFVFEDEKEILYDLGSFPVNKNHAHFDVRLRIDYLDIIKTTLSVCGNVEPLKRPIP